MAGQPAQSPWRQRLHEIIYEADTPAGKGFDVTLIICIVTSVIVVMLDSVISIHAEYGSLLKGVEWLFTLIFTIEYILRLLCVLRPWLYMRSFFGLVDLFAILPTFISFLFPGTHYLLNIRILRLLRIFRVLKLAHYLDEAQTLRQALKASSRKISVFLLAVFALVVILGSVMYLIEGPENGFTNIPISVYWAIVTLTTVGYGDIAPVTALGKIVASMIMVIGYGIIAVPTGIVTVELSQAQRRQSNVSTQACPNCSAQDHDLDAIYCKYCGHTL
ncbi:ion transporter [Celerinatantimonas yamalensis]|uniref:Ion transporter n=1 Tax=Celerinatantimonas yamalensis TaxID=559956 RepID=A0ABW9G511_9GAMM